MKRLSWFVLLSIAPLVAVSGCAKKAPPAPVVKRQPSPPPPPPPAVVRASAANYNDASADTMLTASPPKAPKAAPKASQVTPWVDLYEDRQRILQEAAGVVRRLRSLIAANQLAELAATANSSAALERITAGLEREKGRQEVELELLDTLTVRYSTWQAATKGRPEGRGSVTGSNPLRSLQQVRPAAEKYDIALESFKDFLLVNWLEFAITAEGKRVIRRHEFGPTYQKNASSFVQARRAYDRALAALEQVALTEG